MIDGFDTTQGAVVPGVDEDHKVSPFPCLTHLCYVDSPIFTSTGQPTPCPSPLCKLVPGYLGGRSKPHDG